MVVVSVSGIGIVMIVMVVMAVMIIVAVITMAHHRSPAGRPAINNYRRRCAIAGWGRRNPYDDSWAASWSPFRGSF